MLNNEIWKDIYELPYEISNLGNVRRKADSKYKHKGKEYVAPYKNNKGYMCINLYMNSKVHKYQIHRLIAIFFIPNPNNLTDVNHIDGNPLNNAISNLEWCTHADNIKHAWNTGLVTNRHANASNKKRGGSSQYVGVSWSEQRKKWCTHIRVHKKSIGLGRYLTEVEAAKAYDNYVIANDLFKLGYSTNFV